MTSAKMQWISLSRLLLLLLALCAAPLHAQFDAARIFQQSGAVQARYADPAVQYNTPGFMPGRTDFTSHEEMLEFVYGLQARSDNLHIRIVGQSQEGRSIPLLVMSNSGFTAAADLQRLNRPIVFLVGLQHGNEPAGGEAMLVLAQQLATGPLRPLLDKLTIVIMPHGNPDGAHYFRRSPHGTVDINRDHIKVELPETQALHRAVNEFQPHVFVDAHEFSVATRWIEKFGVIQSYDLMLQYATNPNVPPRLTEMSDRLFLPNMRREIERAGYTHFWYYTTSYDLKDMRVAMGGATPDIGRNFAGLQNAISFLIESRGVGIGRDSYVRRVHGQMVSLTALLNTTADNAAQVMRTVNEVRADVARRGRVPAADDTIAVTLRSPLTRQKLAMLDPQSAQIKQIEVEWSDTLGVEVVLTRVRPYAYLLPVHLHAIAERLMRSGVEVRQLRKPATLAVESYEVTERRAGAVNVEGHTLSTVTTEVSVKQRNFPAGVYVIPMAQPNAAVIAAALEPESPSSFVTFGIIPVDKKGSPVTIAAPSEVPTWRLMRPVALDVRVVEPR
jgi:Zinc carboxypeptidase